MITTTKTGTTIVGLTFKSGIILASDTRSTSGPIVADKNCFKVHYIADNVYACGAGTAADTDRVTLLASTTLKLFEKKYNKIPRVEHCVRFVRNHLHSYNGAIGAALIIAGVDSKDKHLYSISPHGYHAKQHFISMGSGSLAATTILEAGYKKDMEKDEAIHLAVDAVKAGILNDLYSGSNVDVVIIEQDEKEIFNVDVIRGYLTVAKREDEKRINVSDLKDVNVISEEIYYVTDEIE